MKILNLILRRLDEVKGVSAATALPYCYHYLLLSDEACENYFYASVSDEVLTAFGSPLSVGTRFLEVELEFMTKCLNSGKLINDIRVKSLT
ncbi:MAG: hypothetical protein IJL50_08185 [Bacteroidaceae bacterium]|jgi:hypothetical protein|nr:hypothetical protein [Bacteroidaceae bacterium]